MKTQRIVYYLIKKDSFWYYTDTGRCLFGCSKLFLCVASIQPSFTMRNSKSILTGSKRALNSFKMHTSKNSTNLRNNVMAKPVIPTKRNSSAQYASYCLEMTTMSLRCHAMIHISSTLNAFRTGWRQMMAAPCAECLSLLLRLRNRERRS